MKKNKKIIILISIIIILAVIFSFFQIRKSYLFNADNNGIIDGKSELINRLEKIEDKEERKKQKGCAPPKRQTAVSQAGRFPPEKAQGRTS